MGWSQGGYISAFLRLHIRSLRGDFGWRRHLELGHLLLQHRYHTVHNQLSGKRSGGGSGHLFEDFADDL